MRELLLIRHAKSSWKYDVIDAKRPLKQRGLNDADLVSKAFKTIGFRPDKIFSSPANRALTTCKIFMTNLEYDETILEINDALYDFGGENVINFLRQLDNHYEKVIIFGHNHAFTSICNIFGDIFIDNLPTCGLVLIQFNADRWQTIENGKTKLKIFPRDLK